MDEKTKILMIDDEEDFCFFVKANLENTGEFTVAEANSGKAGIELARSGKPDIILLDIAMPEMYGDEVAEVLREDSRTRDIPVIFLTAMVTEDEGESGAIQTIGGNDFVAKPVSSDDLISAIRHVLNRSS